MEHLVNNILKPVLIVALAGVLSFCMPAEAPISPLDVPYTEATLRCTQKAESLRESQECRAKVNWQYGLCPDASEKVPC
jgi:hypothetical protein